MELVPKGVDPESIDMGRYLELDDMEQDDLFEECLRYEVTLKQALDRIAELERKQPKSRDGKTIFLGDGVWFRDPDMTAFDSEAIACEKVVSIYAGKGYKEYDGDFTICCETYEAGNLEFYSSHEECLKDLQIEQESLIEWAEQQNPDSVPDGDKEGTT